jgi:hypothetical protein
MPPLTPWSVLLLLTGLQLKHVVCDGPLQTLAMVTGKVNYGNPVGLGHSLIHAAGSLGVLLLLQVPAGMALPLAAADGAIHYHIDFIKENLVKSYKLSSRDRRFWWWLAADQGLHHLTYICMVGTLIALAPRA